MGADGDWISLGEALGPAEGRYFSAGYRRVEHRLAEAGQKWEDLHCGVVQYPPDWSLDVDGTERIPHLSSVDAIVLPLLLCSQIDDQLQVGSAGSTSWRIRGVELRAGDRPWTELDQVPILVAEPPVWSSHDGVEVGARVGNIRVRIGLSEEKHDDHLAEGIDRHPYPNLLGDLRLGPAAGDCRVRQSTTALHGLESDHDRWASDFDRGHKGRREYPQAAPTAIDYFALMGQLTQALVYRTYATDRASIGNLWMRAIRMTFPESSVTADPFQATTTIIQNTEFKLAQQNIRSVKVLSRTSHGVSAEASVAISFNQDVAI